MCNLSPIKTLAIILVCCILFHGSESRQQELCVKANANSPDDISDDECQPLVWYINNFNGSFPPNTKLLFQEGVHSLDVFLHISDSYNITLAGNGSASRSRAGIPLPSATINCTESSSSGLIFTRSRNIYIYNMKFTLCSGKYTLTKKRYRYAGCLLFNFVQNIALIQVVVNNTKGIALHCINIYGNNTVMDSAFLHSSPYPYKQIRDSSNADIFFDKEIGKVKLIVNSSWFLHGKSWNSSGGLNIHISSTNIHINLTNVTVQGNNGQYGGNIAITITSFTENSSSIVIENSQIMDGLAYKGAGLRLWSKQKSNTEGPFTHSNHHILNISHTVFNGNIANLTGGAMFIAYDNIKSENSTDMFDGTVRHITFSNCHYVKNGGDGAAMEIIQLNHHNLPFFQTSIKHCVFQKNFVQTKYIGPVLDFISVEVSITNTTISGSNSTAISLRKSYLHIYGYLYFQNNTANKGQLGGALKLCDTSLLLVHPRTHVKFIGNYAHKGGAIYVQQYCMDTAPPCFVQPYISDEKTVLEVVEQITFEFINNTAEVAGDALYGGIIDQCSVMAGRPWNTSHDRHNEYWYSKDMFETIFPISEKNRPSYISSDPLGVCFCDSSQQNSQYVNCTKRMGPLEKYPGEKINVSLITVGQLNGTTSGIIEGNLMNEDKDNLTVLEFDNPDIRASVKCVDFNFTLKSKKQDNVNITFKSMESEFGTMYNLLHQNITVRLLQCPLGFQLSVTSPYKCICIPLLKTFLGDDSCDISRRTIHLHQHQMWIGCINHGKHNSFSLNCTNNIAISSVCTYCRTSTNKTMSVPITNDNADSQCLPGHTGILCGACKSKYSRVFGANGCHKHCTNKNLPYLFIFFLAYGIILIVIITILNLTVTEGTINGLLVYTMVIQTHHTYFPEDPSGFGRVCWVFISLINLTFGSKVCSYRGMDGYQQIWSLFLQAFYLLFILILIILLSRKFIFFTRLMGRNTIKVLATLVSLLHTNLSFAAFYTFQYTTVHVHTLNGSQYTSVVWYYDGNLTYFGLKHAILFVVALICSIVMAFFVFSLLLIQCLQKRSNLLCLRWVDRFRPFFEAFTGPCRDNYRFWPGFLLFMRTGVFTLISLIPVNDEFFQVKMLLTAAVFVLVMSLAWIFPKGIYKRWPINLLEFSFFLNICITSGFLGIHSNRNKGMYAVCISVSIAALTFFGILVYHCYSQIRNTALWRNLSIRFAPMLQCCVNFCNRRKEINQDEEDNDTTALLSGMMPAVID